MVDLSIHGGSLLMGDKTRPLTLVHLAYLLLRKILTAAGLSRSLRRLLGPLAGRTVSRFTANARQPLSVRGHQMILAAEGRYPPIAMAMDRYEAETTILFESLVGPGMVVVDVGAHVGYYALLAARQVRPTGKVYAFEPEPGNYELLLGNIERNGYSNISAIREAISNQVGTATLFLTALDNGRHSAYQHGLPGRGSMAVATTTLDAFFEALGWPPVDVVKVDVEGAEMDVVEGMGQLLQKSPHLTLIVEFSPTLLQDGAADPLQFLKRLQALHFRISRIVDQHGAVALPQEDYSWLIDKLLKNDGSVNLFCSRQ